MLNKSRITIENNLPIPPKRLNEIKYPFQDMEINDSFAIPVTDETKKRIRCSIATSASQWGKRRNSGIRFTTRITLNNDGNQLECRVWRTE